MTILGEGTRLDWTTARSRSPVRSAWREGKPHPEAVSEWLWLVAPVPMSSDGWWPVVAFRTYAGFGTSHALNSSALDTVEDWQPVIPGTEKGEQCLELLRKFFALKARIASGELSEHHQFVRPIDPEHEAKYFVLSSKNGVVTRGDDDV